MDETNSTDTKAQLQDLLNKRPSKAQVSGTGVMPVGQVTSGLQGTARTLERNMISSSLNRKLGTRSFDKTLQKGGVGVANPIRSKVVSLEHNFKRNKVSQGLRDRPDMAALLSQGIVKNADPRVASKLQKTQRDLAHNLAKSNLFHGLKHRPTVDELRQAGLYKDAGREEEEEEGEEADDSSAPDEHQQYQDMREEQYRVQHEAWRRRQQIEQKQYASAQPSSGYERRSKNFHLTRILLKYVNSWGESGDFSLTQKGLLKDLIVDQDPVVLAVAEAFDAENDLADFKDSLSRLTQRRDF